MRCQQFVALILPLLTAALLAQEPPKLAVPEAKRDATGTVTLTCATPGAVIRYSVDGSDPGPKGGPYLAPIVLPAGGTVKARAYTEDRRVKSELFEAKFEAVAGAKPLPSTLVPCTQDRDWPIYDWAKRHAAVTKIAADRKASLVFIGDSITQMFGG
ncbi:MAG: chitobiase/beta-hexosaminidase C-terminal domain-containing protein, partial [Verrucomicrobia bacterium]|nr:chitobiase/beta-hexosaminidase C-terminal domain-containing protein [Verrucomicrobiota bacterium]